MKKPALTLLAIAVPLALALAVWLAVSSSERGTRAAPTAPAPAAATEVPVALTPSAPAADIAPAEIASAPVPTSLPVADEREELASDDSGRRIRGRVRIPAGAPDDDTLRVVALTEALEPRQVYGTGGVLADLAEGKKERVRGTAPVAPDGSFELALGAPGDVWLALDGRFLYSTGVERARAAEATIELHSELGGCLAGRVRVPADAPAGALEEVALELGIDGEDFAMSSIGSAPLFGRRAKPDGEGRFELRALPAGYRHELEVRAKALADAKVSGLEFAPGRVRELEVDLLTGATLRGTVRDEEGRPVAQAEVVAAESAIWGFPGEELAEVESDASGVFALEHVASGKCLLLAKKSGSLESEALELEIADREQRDGLELVLGQGAAITGTVRQPDGSPAGGASVEVSFDPEALVGMGALNAARGASSKATAAADGRFEASGLGKGPFLVRATLARTAADGAQEKLLAKATHVKPDTHDLELTLAAPNAVAGRVRDLAGEPVTQFLLRATMDSAAFYLPGEARTQPCQDPEGDFVLRDLEAGSWKLEASADGFGPMEPLALVLPRADETPLELVLAPAASITGRVLDPSGSPARGAMVTVHLDNAMRIQRLRNDVKSPETASAEDGTFLLGGLGSGTISIHALRAGLAPSEPVSVDTQAGETAQGVVLRLRKGGVITGEVYGRNGKPAGGVRIVAQEPGSLNTNIKPADGEGRFRFEALAPGSWTITALLEDGEVDPEGSEGEATAALFENMRFTMVELADGEEEHVVLGAPPKDPVLVRGRVRHGDQPVEQGMVSFFAEGSKGLEALKIAPIGSDGRYQTELGGPGPYAVTVQVNAGGATFQQNNVEFRETIPEVEEHVLDFSMPLGGLRGTVRGPDKKPLSGARVTLAVAGGIESGSLLGGNYSEAVTDDEGRYDFAFLRPGRYTVAAGGALFGGAFGGQSLAGRLIRSDLRVSEGKVLEGVDFELDEPGTIRGRVVDALGGPVKDASIFVRDGEGQLLDRFSMITSKADGTFQYDGVSEGEYLVSARAKEQASVESEPVRVPEGGSASVELVMQPGTRLVVEVVGDDGEPVRALITVTDARGREMQGMLGFAEMAAGFQEGFDSSRHTVGPLAPGSYTVKASVDGRETTKPVTLEGQPERRIKLRLR